MKKRNYHSNSSGSKSSSSGSSSSSSSFESLCGRSSYMLLRQLHLRKRNSCRIEPKRILKILQTYTLDHWKLENQPLNNTYKILLQHPTAYLGTFCELMGLLCCLNLNSRPSRLQNSTVRRFTDSVVSYLVPLLPVVWEMEQDSLLIYKG